MRQTLIVNKTNYDKPWAAEFLSGILRSDMKVCVISDAADEGWTMDREGWDTRFGEDSDFRYDIERPLRSYGIRYFFWYDPYRDEAEPLASKIRESDITVLFGTNPVSCMDTIMDLGIEELLIHGNGLLITISEVSSLLCGSYEVEEAGIRSVREGLGILSAASLCMHYEEHEEQLARMIRLLEVLGGSLLVLSENSGVYLDGTHIELLGDAFIADESDLEELYALIG
ncbi:MAG: hypothetical protein IJ225_07525 [Solobacterium sp.]|nr:hypothetical protein [Solobacterium sp.]